MKQVKIRSLKYPDPSINWDFQAEDPQPKIAELEAFGVLGFPERPELDEMGQPTGVILPAEYTVEIEDITSEYNLQQVIAARKAEYPSAEEFMNAFFDGGEEAIAALQAKRLEIKAKYPKN
jgi:hypothetical protein